MGKKIIDVNRMHPVYKTMLPYWQYYMDSYKGGKDYIKPINKDILDFIPIEDTGLTYYGSYLYPSELERLPQLREKFINRHNRSFYDNFCQLPVNTYTKYIYNRLYSIKREVTEENSGFEPYIDDISLQQESINDFMKRWTINMLVYGVSYVVIDKSPLPETITTLLQQMEVGNRAYASIIEPHNVKDWSINPQTGLYNWVLIRSSYRKDEDYSDTADAEIIYYLWTPTETYILDQGSELVNDNNFPVNPIQHNLGIIPIIKATYNDIDRDGYPESMLSTIADINREIYNIDSMYQEELYKLAFAQIMRQKGKDDWTEDNADESDMKKQLDKILSTSTWLEYDPDTNPPQYLEFPVGALVEKRQRKNELIQDILRLSGLGLQTGVENYQSGLAMSFAYSDTYTNVAQLANRLEYYEKLLWYFIKLYDQVNESTGLVRGDLQIQYPDRFDVKTSEERRRDYETAKMNLNHSPTAMLIADMDYGMDVFKWEDNEQQQIYDELQEYYTNNPQPSVMITNSNPMMNGNTETEITNENPENEDESQDEQQRASTET